MKYVCNRYLADSELGAFDQRHDHEAGPRCRVVAVEIVDAASRQSAPRLCSPDWDRIRWHIVTYLSHFLAAQKGVATPVGLDEKHKAESMAADLIEWIRENKVLSK